MPPGDRLVAAATGRLGSFTGEDGVSDSASRPPLIGIGLSESAVFAFGRRGFSARAFLPLLTHAKLESGGLMLQWVTPRDTGACLIAHLDAPEEFWTQLKRQRDEVWLGIPRSTQRDMLWFSGSLPGVIWRNQDDLSLPAYQAMTESFVNGAAAPRSAYACGLVNAPISLRPAASSVHRQPAAAMGDTPSPRRPAPKRRRG